MSVAKPELDAVALSSLLSSRLCHDLINPIGAISSGLEVLQDKGMDQGMRDAALDLIRSGGEKSISLLKFARLAYGVAGGHGAQVPLEEAEAMLRDLYRWTKAELVWKLKPGLAAKEKVKAIMILVHAAADCIPRGGSVTVSGEGGDVLIEATGQRVILQEDLVKAIAGEIDDIKPKFTPAYMAGLLARGTGGDASAVLDSERIFIRAKFL